MKDSDQFFSAGLKIMLVCFQSQLAREWHRIATVVKELGSHMMGKYHIGIQYQQFKN